MDHLSKIKKKLQTNHVKQLLINQLFKEDFCLTLMKYHIILKKYLNS
jgi:hypothetical protein